MSTMTHGTNWSGGNTQNKQEQTYNFATASKFIDKDISFKVKAQDGVLASSSGSVSATNANLSTTDTSGISVTGSGKGVVTTSGWIESSSTTTPSTQTKYLTGVTISNGKSFNINDGIYNWTYSVDANGNVTIS